MSQLHLIPISVGAFAEMLASFESFFAPDKLSFYYEFVNIDKKGEKSAN